MMGDSYRESRHFRLTQTQVDIASLHNGLAPDLNICKSYLVCNTHGVAAWLCGMPGGVVEKVLCVRWFALHSIKDVPLLLPASKPVVLSTVKGTLLPCGLAVGVQSHMRSEFSGAGCEAWGECGQRAGRWVSSV